MSAVPSLPARHAPAHSRECQSCRADIGGLPSRALRCLACQWYIAVAEAHRQLDAWQLVPANVRRRLGEEGVFSLGDWRSLGPRRLEIFGVTRGMAQQIDQLAGVA